jgi:hypothetical protein
MTKETVGGAGSQDQIVVREFLAIAQPHAAARGIHADYFRHQHRGIVEAAQEHAARGGDLGRRQRRRRHLIQQWLEQVMIGAIHQRDVGIRVLQCLHGGHAAKSRADDHDSLPARCTHRRCSRH